MTKAEPAVKAKPHTSYSQLSMAMRCGESYRRRYIEGERLPPVLAMARGTGVHKGIATNFRQKMTSHRDLKTQDIIDAAVSAFDTAIADGLLTTPDQRSIGIQIVIGETIDLVSDMAQEFAVQAAPEYQPIFVEQRIEIEFPNSPRNLLAILDVGTIDEVADFKTSGRKKKQAEVDHDLQLTVYDVAYHAYTGHKAEKVSFDTIVATKTNISRQKLTGSRDMTDRLNLARTINEFSRLLAAGVFMPSMPGRDWWCYSMDTELLTRGGWKPGWSVERGETILAYDDLTGLLDWQPVLATIRKEWNKPMVSYNGRGLKFCVTPDHRLLVRSLSRGRSRTVLAQDVVGKGSISYPISAYLPRPGVSFSNDELALAGWLCAEGSFETDCGAVCLYQKQTGQYYEELIELIRRLGYEHKVYEIESANKIRFPSETGYRIRNRIIADKSIPGWLHDCDARQFRVWLAAFLKGDGSKTTNPSNWAVAQKSERFIDELQAICVTHRMSAVKGTKRRRSSTGGYFSSLSILDGITHRTTEPASKGTHFEHPIEDEVWCVTVPSGWLMTRYRGRTLIAGNCSPNYCGFWSSCPYVNSNAGTPTSKNPVRKKRKPR